MYEVGFYDKMMEKASKFSRRKNNKKKDPIDMGKMRKLAKGRFPKYKSGDVATFYGFLTRRGKTHEGLPSKTLLVKDIRDENGSFNAEHCWILDTNALAKKIRVGKKVQLKGEVVDYYSEFRNKVSAKRSLKLLEIKEVH